MDIVYKSKNAVIINKPIGTPSETDPSGDMDALKLTSVALTDMGEVGDVYPVHRLDRVVGGVLLIARSSNAAARISERIRDRQLVKEYFAVVEGRPQSDHGVLTDLLYKDARQGKSFVTNRMRSGVKEATLEYSLLGTARVDGGERSLLRVRLGTGRHHQIRVQLSSRRLPIVGDGKYGSRDHGCHTPALFSCRIEASIGKEKIGARILPELGAYPWSLFEADSYSFGD